jgi:aldose 1-epimerase
MIAGWLICKLAQAGSREIHCSLGSSQGAGTGFCNSNPSDANIMKFVLGYLPESADLGKRILREGRMIAKGMIELTRRVLVIAVSLTAVAHGEVIMSIWGQTAEGVPVPIYTLTSAHLEARVMAYGARLVSIRTPDRAGKMADVVLGYDTLQDYLNDRETRFGSVVGRFANRIALGSFSIDGKTYQIPANDGRNALHGGPFGFDRYVWQAQEVPNGVEFRHMSPDGDMGFPGTLIAKVRYTLIGNELRIDYFAVTDRATVLNLTNHVYFNLRGDGNGDILGERAQLNADWYTPTNAQQIPTGRLVPVADTPFDFRTPTIIGARINDPNEQLWFGSGYDHNFVVNRVAGTLRRAAIVTDPESRRGVTVETTEPGVQFYTGNHLDGTFTGRHGVEYGKNAGFCLETQHFPDSPNHGNFPSTVLRPGRRFHSTTIFTFSTNKAE